MNIPLGGVSNEPNDYSSEDGALSLSLNAVKHHGSIRPVMPGSPVKDIRELEEGMDIVAIHEIGNMKHYIVLYEDTSHGARPGEGDTYYLYYVNLPDKVKVWWDSNGMPPATFGGGIRAEIGYDKYVSYHMISDTWFQVTEIPAKGLCVGRGGDSTYTKGNEVLDANYKEQTPVFNGIESGEGKWGVFMMPLTDIKNWSIKVKTKPGSPIKAAAYFRNKEEWSDVSQGDWKGVWQQNGSEGGLSGDASWDDINYIGVIYTHKDANVSPGLDEVKEWTEIEINYTIADGQGPVYYDYEAGRVVTNDVITMKILRKENGSIVEENVDTLIKVNAQKEDQDLPVEEDTDDTGGGYLLMYIDANEPVDKQEAIEISTFSDKVIGVTAMGNVLTIARKGKPLTYVIWQEAEYRKLGTGFKMPRAFPYLLSSPMGQSELYSKFGANFMEQGADTSLKDENTLDAATWRKLKNGETNYLNFNATQQKFVCDKVFGIVNSAHRILSNKSFFYAPFFVRFALRMYDGKHIMHTPPRLMIPNASGKPLLGVIVDDNGEAILHPVFVGSKLCVDIEKYTPTTDGLITHLDVFVSLPLIQYTDASDSIKGAGVINMSGSAQSGTATNPYNATYMKDRKTLGDFHADYTDANNVLSSINIESTTITSGLEYYNNDFTLTAEYLYLIDKTRYPNIQAFDMSGMNRPLPTAKGTYPIGKTAEGKSILLSDTGLTNLTNYVYFSIASTSTSSEKWIGLSGYPVIDAIIVWCYRSTQLENKDFKYILDVNRTDGINFKDIVLDNNTFHLVKSIPIQELKNGWSGDLHIEEMTLPGLSTRQNLTDNGQMRNKVSVDMAPFAYNNRLSTVVSRMTLPTTDKLADFCVQSVPDKYKGWYIEKAWIKANINGQLVYKQLEIGNDNGKATYAENIRYFYYPDNSATHLILQLFAENDSPNLFRVHTYTLNKHKLMNGTYLFNDFDALVPSSVATYAQRSQMDEDESIKSAEQGKRDVAYGNMVRVSGVGNPFYFNEVNQVQLPSGKISGLSTTAKALSQGQFGAFPLYCFSDNGIWALEVSDTGTYSAKQPVSRAVCTNPESITQTDGEVLFVTKRGLMSISGSETSCISEVLSGHNYTSKISKLAEVMTLAGFESVKLPDHIEEWMQDARFLYDDMRRYIYAFKSDDTLGYIYSISDQAWGMFVNDLEHPLPTYTDALAVEKDAQGQRRLINMSDYNQTDHESSYKSLLITRPMTLGSADAYKTIEALVLRGMIDKDDDKDDDKNYSKLVIWASNDLKKWAIVGTSKTSWYRGKSGTPYKYYRIGLLLDWKEEDSVSGISADVTTRLTNRMR